MIRSGVLGRDDTGAVIGIIDVGGVYSGCWRAGVQIWVAFAPETGEEKGIARTEVVGADAGALEAVDDFVDHVAHATGFFGTGDAEEASLL